MRIERIVLEDHGDVPALWFNIVDDTPADDDFPFGYLFQSSDHSQKGRLAAAGGAEQHDKRTILDRRIDAMQDLDAAESLDDRTDLDRGHGAFPPNRTPDYSPRIGTCSRSYIGRLSSVFMAPQTLQTRWFATSGTGSRSGNTRISGCPRFMYERAWPLIWLRARGSASEREDDGARRRVAADTLTRSSVGERTIRIFRAGSERHCGRNNEGLAVVLPQSKCDRLVVRGWDRKIGIDPILEIRRQFKWGAHSWRAPKPELVVIIEVHNYAVMVAVII